MVLIKSKKPGLRVKSHSPSYNIEFGEKPVDVPAEHAKKILMNSGFYKVGAGDFYTRKQLEGTPMPALRKVGNKFNVKDTSKKELIEEILRAQEKR